MINDEIILDLKEEIAQLNKIIDEMDTELYMLRLEVKSYQNNNCECGCG